MSKTTSGIDLEIDSKFGHVKNCCWLVYHQRGYWDWKQLMEKLPSHGVNNSNGLCAFSWWKEKYDTCRFLLLVRVVRVHFFFLLDLVLVVYRNCLKGGKALSSWCLTSGCNACTWTSKDMVCNRNDKGEILPELKSMLWAQVLEWSRQ